jgi:hypothetical protein
MDNARQARQDILDLKGISKMGSYLNRRDFNKSLLEGKTLKELKARKAELEAKMKKREQTAKNLAFVDEEVNTELFTDAMARAEDEAIDLQDVKAQVDRGMVPAVVEANNANFAGVLSGANFNLGKKKIPGGY